MNPSMPKSKTPRTDAFAFSESRRCHESGALCAPGDTEWLEFCQKLETELAEAQAQVVAYREAHDVMREAILNERHQLAEENAPVNAILGVVDDAFAAALSSPPPPVVPAKALADLLPFVLEDYYPNAATPSFKAAVEQAQAAIAAIEAKPQTATRAPDEEAAGHLAECRTCDELHRVYDPARWDAHRAHFAKGGKIRSRVAPAAMASGKYSEWRDDREPEFDNVVYEFAMVPPHRHSCTCPPPPEPHAEDCPIHREPPKEPDECHCTPGLPYNPACPTHGDDPNDGQIPFPR